jgi:hypothetical protein
MAYRFIKRREQRTWLEDRNCFWWSECGLVVVLFQPVPAGKLVKRQKCRTSRL